MTDARQRSFWHRAGPLAATAALIVGATAPGCKCGESDAPTGSTSSTGTGGSGGSGGTGGSGEIAFGPSIDAPSPMDATPDPDGNTIYFTAVGDNGPGVFKGPPGGAATEIKAGDPFAAPFGIAIGSDGTQLYIADPAADAGGDRGVVFVLPVDGGNPTQLMGTADAVPRSLEVRKEDEADVVYFTGTDPATGDAGVFKVPATGGALTKVNKSGVKFFDPSGIALAADGSVYVADTIASATQTADIVVIDPSGAAKSFATGLYVGYPCGVALSQDDKTVFVSGLDPVSRTDRLIAIDVATATVSLLFEAEIGKFRESAGLHRAKNKQVFAWADSSAGPMGGKVFVVK